MANHDQIRKMSEQEAVSLFESVEIRTAADTVATCFREADLLCAQGEDCRRRGTTKALETQAQRLEAQAKLQAEGGRVAHVQANRLATEATDLYLEAARLDNEGEKRTLEGEATWAELAHRHGAYIPHGRRLEVRAVETPTHVYCFDVDEGEMALHQEDACPPKPLRHDKDSKMLRRRNSKGKLALWPGRREV